MTVLRVRYATLMRPPVPGSIPKEGLLEVKDIKGITPSGHPAWGWAEYDRFLTEQQIKEYELEYISKTNPIMEEQQ